MKQLKEIIETIQEQHASKYSIYYERLAKELNVISKNEQIKNTLLFLCDVNDCLEDTFGRYYFRGELNNSLLCYYLLNLCNDPIKDGLVFELAFEKKRFWLPSLQLSTRTFEALVQFLLEFYDVFLLNEDEKQYQRMGSVEEEREIYDFLIMPKHHCVTDENDYNCIYIYVFVDKRLDLLEVLNSRKQKDEYTEKELEAIFKTFNCISEEDSYIFRPFGVDSSEELFRKIYNKEIETDDELMRFLSFLDTNMNPSILKVPLQEIPSTREELYVKLTSEMGIYPDMAYRIISIVRKGKVATNIEELSDLPPTLLDWLSDIKYMYSKSYLLVEIKILKELLYYKSFHKKDYIEAKKIIIDENEQG